MLGLIRLGHPFPSILNALATTGIALLAGGDPGTAVRLGAAMLCMQASIGALNDVADAELDRVGKPAKPIPAGLVTRASARAWADRTAALGLVLAVPSGLATVAIAAIGLALGFAYDLRLSRTALSWLPLALALPLLPAFAWLGATGSIPVELRPLLAAAVFAGIALSIANGLVDVERDRLAGKPTIPVRLGRDLSWVIHAGAFALVAFAFALGPAPPEPGAPAEAIATLFTAALALSLPLGAMLIVAGAALLAHPKPGIRERGWELECIGTLAVGLGWLAWIVAR